MTNKLTIIPIIAILVLLLTVSFASAVGTAPDNADVEGYWTMENVTDSTNRNNLTLSGATVGVSNGIIDKAGYFDGANDWMSYSSADLGSSYSISVWVKLDDTSTYGVITAGAGGSSTGRYDGMIIINLGDFSFIGENGDSGVPTTTALSINTWYHVVGVADGLTRKIYLNGSLESSTTETNNAKFDTTRFFGKRDDGRYLGGLIDEVTIFDTVLTSDEITFLYNEGTPTSDQQYPFTSGPSPFFAVTSKDFWTNGSVSSFWAYIDGSNYSSNYTGTLNTTLLQNDTSLYTIQVGGTNYYTETYTDVNISSNFEGVLHQSETSFYPVEYLTNYQLWSSWYDNMSVTVDGRSNQSVIETVTGNYSVFYLNSAEHTVQINLSDYYTVNWVVNISAGTTNRLVWTNSSGLFYNNLVTFNLKDVVTTDLVEVNTTILIEGVSDSGGTMSLQTYTSTNGTVSFPFLQGTFNITAYSDDYATLIENVTINSTVQEFNYSLYANNSLWVTAIDQVTGSALNNFTVEVFNVNDSFTAVDNLTFKATLDNITSGVYTVKVTKDDYAVAEYALTMTGGSHQNLIAYMTANGSTTIFNVVDSLSSQIIEGASASMYKTINSTWTLISSQNTDITGRVQYTYVPDVEYKFIIDAVGFELRTFFLKPLFSSYTIRLTPDLVSVPDENTGAYVYSINNSGLFYNSLNNSFEVSISSGTGTLEYYDLTVTNFNGSSSSVNCLTADGCSDSFLVEVVDSYFGDFVTVEYSIKESGRSLKYFKNVYHVQDVFISSTLEAWKDVDDDTVDSLGKAFIAMIICFVTVGFVAVSSSMVGVPPVTASGVVLAMLVGVFAYVGFIPALAGGLVILGCIMIVIFGRGEI